MRNFEDLEDTKVRSNGIELWVALTSHQVSLLDSEEGAPPDPYSNRYGLRRRAAEALERAHCFMQWRPDGESRPSLSHKDFTLCKINITAEGYLFLCETGQMYSSKPGEWRLLGNLRSRLNAEVVQEEPPILVYELSPEMHRIC
ncbi:unnamed protein product [Symbiodinium sp. CCMP2456]|nr:unnamed protein product [Symbiodinium sp. CCMP2456]